jgi:hypothetical protein
VAWTAPPIFVSGSTLTAAQMNILSDDLRETASAKATTAGSFFATTAANTIAERIPTIASVLTSQTTGSNTYTDLATVGPQLTAATAATALIIITIRSSNNTAASGCFMGYEISGATSLAADDSRALINASGTNSLYMSWAVLSGGLTAGSNTWTVKYRVTSGTTGTFSDRRLTIIPY